MALPMALMCSASMMSCPVVRCERQAAGIRQREQPGSSADVQRCSVKPAIFARAARGAVQIVFPALQAPHASALVAHGWMTGLCGMLSITILKLIAA